MEQYVNGSDVLLNVGDEEFGHSTSHTTTFTSETKERAVKPPAKEGKSASLFKGKTVVSLGVSIQAEGLEVIGETATGIKALRKAWRTAKPIPVECYEREKSKNPYLSGELVITQIE